MIIHISSELESVLNDLAHKHGLTPEILAINALRERFLSPVLPVQPKDEWERLLLSAATDCGVALSDQAVSSDGLYE